MKKTFEHFQSSQGLIESIVINPLKGTTITPVTFIEEYPPPPPPVEERRLYWQAYALNSNA